MLLTGATQLGCLDAPVTLTPTPIGDAGKLPDGAVDPTPPPPPPPPADAGGVRLGATGVVPGGGVSRSQNYTLVTRTGGSPGDAVSGTSQSYRSVGTVGRQGQ